MNIISDSGHLQAKLVPTIVANYVLWPAAHFVNFRFVPTEHRILYNNCVSVRQWVLWFHRHLTLAPARAALVQDLHRPARLQRCWRPLLTHLKLVLLYTAPLDDVTLGHTGVEALLSVLARIKGCVPQTCNMPGREVLYDHDANDNWSRSVWQVAWNAYLSTLSHAPVLDTEGLLGVIDQAQGLLDSFLPVEIQVRAGP